nr:HAMP domain-containing sensor histidine kinase [Parvularcula maris]
MPRLGLGGRLVLILAAVVIAGQLVNGFLLVRAEQRDVIRRAEAVLADRLVQAALVHEEDRPGARRFLGRRGARIRQGPPEIGEPNPSATEQLRAALTEAGVAASNSTVRTVERERGFALIGAVELGEGRWLTTLTPMPRPRKLPWRLIALQAGVLTLVLLIPAVWLARSVTAPMRTLTAVADGFLSGRPSPPLPTRGPPDVRALASALDTLESRVLGALERQSVMLGAVGHDLRTPLASLRILVESVSDEALRRELIGGVERIDRTLADILTFASSGARPDLEEIRCEALMRRAAEAYAAQDVVVEKCPGAILGAPDALLRALRNLIDNALRHGGGKARLSTEAGGDEILLIVEDRGRGLPETEAARLLRPFERGDRSRSSATPGSGLGLSIAAAIAEAHGGCLELKPAAGGGTRALIRLKKPQM